MEFELLYVASRAAFYRGRKVERVRRWRVSPMEFSIRQGRTAEEYNAATRHSTGEEGII